MNVKEINNVNNCLFETFEKSFHGNIFEGRLEDDDQSRASGCILMYQDRMLLQKRSSDSDEGGSYACFGGSAKIGEDLLETMYREVEEECKLSKEDIYDVLPFTEFKDGNFLFKTYIGRIKDEAVHRVLTDNESQGWVFKTFSEALKMNLHPNFRLTLEQAHREYMDYQHEFDYVKTVSDIIREDKEVKAPSFFDKIKVPKRQKENRFAK